MATVEYDASYDVYEERAGLDHSWTEYGASPGNWFGLPSHSTKSSDGAKLWAVFGFRWPMGPGGSVRRLNHAAEGPHETSAVMVWRLPLATTLTSAVLNYAPSSVQGAQTKALRLYGVKEGDYRERQIAFDGYPATERSEFYPSIWGRARRYRVDSTHTHRRHTTAQVTWSETWSAIDTYYQSPDIAALLNEILGLSSWAHGNRLCLVLAPNFSIDTTPYNPDWSISAGGGESSGIHSVSSAYPPYLTLTYPD